MLSRMRRAIEVLARPRIAAVLAVAMTGLFAAADFTAPGEINVAIFYVLSVGAAGWTRSRRVLWSITGICCALSIAGLALGPQPSAELVEPLYINRSFVAFGLLIMAAIVHQRMQMLDRFEAARDLQARQNEMLRDSEARVRATFEQAAVGIALSDLRGRFFRVNERLCAITGYSREELLARSYQDITYPDDLERNLLLNQALIDGAFPHFQMEKRYLRRDGSTYWINVTSAVVRRTSGEPDYVIAVIEDISARKRVEAELHRVNAELERRVELELGRRLAAEQSLHQAQKMEAIGQLTGGVAHDFNNILTTVIGNLDRIAARAAPDNPSRRLAEAALRGAENGARLTEQLLSFARRQRLEPEVLEIDRVLGAVIALARRTVSETIELSLELGADLWRCCLDPAQLQSAVLNLVINARDAMLGAGRVTIAARNETVGSGVPDLAAGEYVRLSVADTGSGMAPEVLARVFEPFFTTKGVGKGSGLGLSMVYGFAKQSGGTVRIESAPGRGTTVQLYLPRTTRMPARAEPLPPRPMPRAARPATVLIVEDEEDVRQLAAESLEEFGYRVVLAENARAAVAVLERDTIDLLLSDIVMPGGMSGLELADRARRLRCELPVLLTTGYAEAIDHATARGTGVELLRKPFRPRELGAKVHQMLSAAAGE
jgi:PAS domain S-box-containing protein